MFLKDLDESGVLLGWFHPGRVLSFCDLGLSWKPEANDRFTPDGSSGFSVDLHTSSTLTDRNSIKLEHEPVDWFNCEPFPGMAWIKDERRKSESTNPVILIFKTTERLPLKGCELWITNNTFFSMQSAASWISDLPKSCSYKSAPVLGVDQRLPFKLRLETQRVVIIWNKFSPPFSSNSALGSLITNGMQEKSTHPILSPR